MLTAIDFDDELMPVFNKIEDVGIKRRLTAEMISASI